MAWLKDQGKWFLENKGKFWLALAFFLVSALSFEAGMLEQVLREGEPVVIRVPDMIPSMMLPERVSADTPPSSTSSTSSAIPDEPSCAFVGSKHSNKYHNPTSRCAKQIKPANRICFDSIDGAMAKGYLPGCLE